MPLTEEQIREFFRQGIAQGIPKEELIAEVERQNGASRPPAPSRGKLNLSTREAFRQGAPIVPTKAMPETPDVSWGEFLPSAIKRSVGVPITGIAETVGIVDEGTTDRVRASAEEGLVDYLAGDPGVGRTALAGLTMLGTDLIPLTPGGKLGKVAGGALTKQLGKRMSPRAASKVGRLAGGATAAGSEGLVVGIGETVGLEPEERLKRGALMTLAAAGLGSLGAVRAIAADDILIQRRAKGDLSQTVLDKYVETGEVGGKSGSLLERAKAKLFNDQTASVRYMRELNALPEGKKVAEEIRIRNAQFRTASQMSHHPLDIGVTRVNDGAIVSEPWQAIIADIDPARYPEQAADLASKGIDADVLANDLAAFHYLRRHQELVERVRNAKETIPVIREQIKEAIKEAVDPDNDETVFYLKQLLDTYKRRGRLSLDKEANKLTERIREYHERYGTVEVKDNYTGTVSDEPAIIGPLAKRVVDFRRAAILDTIGDPLVGTFDKVQLDDMKRQGEWHIPFKRAWEELSEEDYIKIFEKDPQAAGAKGAAPVRNKRLKGGLSTKDGQRVRNYYEQTPRDAIEAYRFSRKQALRNVLIRTAKEFPEAAIGRELQEVKAGGVRWFDDGQLKHYAAPEHLEKSLEMLDYKEGNIIGKMARSLTNIFRAGATLTLNFAFGNVVRDMFPAGIYTKAGVVPLVGPAMAFAEEGAQVALGRSLKAGEWNEFIKSFAAHTSMVGGETFNAARYMTEVHRMSAHPTKRVTNAALKVTKNPLLLFQGISAGLERLNRFPEFKAMRRRLIKEGVSPDRATQLAGMAGQDITLDFSLGGDLGRTVNMYEAFTNAMLQDVNKFSREMFTKGPRNTFFVTLRAASALTAPSMYFYYKYKDDPDYQSLPEWEKAMFLHIHKRQDGKFARIPLPPGILGMMFSYLPRKAAQAMESSNVADIKPFFTEAIEQTPLRYVPGVNDPKDAFINMFPDAFQPVAEWLGNWKPFFDRPIISQRYLRLKPQAQRTRYTSNLAKTISDAGGAAGLQLSPILIDHVFHSYGAGIGRMITGASGSEAGRAMAKKDGVLGLPVIGPAVGRFVSSSPWGFGSQPVQDFYDFAGQVQESHLTFNMQSSPRRRRDFLNNHPEVLYNKHVNKIRQEISKLAEQRNIIEMSDLDAMEKEDALIKIDQTVTMLAGTVMENLFEAIQVDKLIAQEGMDNATP